MLYACSLRQTVLPFPVATCRVAFVLGVFAVSFEGAWAESIRTNGPVEAVLRDEVSGNVPDRQRALSALLEKTPDNSAARWQAGYYRWKDQWLKYDEPGVDARQRAALDGYQEARAQAEDTVAGQLQLADWCRRRKLVDQERTHLMRVIVLDPNHAQARNRLGWRLIGNRWYQEKEIAEIRARTQAEKDALRKHGPSVQKTISGMASSEPRIRREAESRFRRFTDPDVIPALERYLPGANPEIRVQGVSVLAQIAAPDSSLALARMAVTDSYQESGMTAAKALRDKPAEQYIPALLSLLSSPVASKYAIFQDSNGRVVYRHLFERELEDRRESLELTREIRDPNGGILPFALDLVTAALTDEGRVADANAAIHEMNRRVYTVLRTATREEDVDEQPDAWWKWWYDRNEVYLAGEKPTYRIARTSTVTLPSLAPNRYECLVAGTLVMTLTGPVAVEKVQAGDLVLSQDVRTGELAYRPVLATTVRPPNPVVAIETATDRWRASGGHLFWVVGKGWTRARELKAGHRLRTVTRTTVVETAVAEEQPVETYNLIVGDFHSYFVGADLVLSHDNTIPEPTSAPVPGLLRSDNTQQRSPSS